MRDLLLPVCAQGFRRLGARQHQSDTRSHPSWRSLVSCLPLPERPQSPDGAAIRPSRALGARRCAGGDVRVVLLRARLSAQRGQGESGEVCCNASRLSHRSRRHGREGTRELDKSPPPRRETRSICANAETEAARVEPSCRTGGARRNGTSYNRAVVAARQSEQRERDGTRPSGRNDANGGMMSR